MLSSALGRLRLVGMLEGMSFVLLLGIAMPLKYLAITPLAVRYVGGAHGILFIAYCFLTAHAAWLRSWPLTKSLGVIVASLLPFGPFLIDGTLKREQIASQPTSG